MDNKDPYLLIFHCKCNGTKNNKYISQCKIGYDPDFHDPNDLKNFVEKMYFKEHNLNCQCREKGVEKFTNQTK